MQSQLSNNPIFRFPFAWNDRVQGIQALWVETKLLIGVSNVFRERERMSTLTVDQLKESLPKFNLALKGLRNIYPLV